MRIRLLELLDRDAVIVVPDVQAIKRRLRLKVQARFRLKVRFKVWMNAFNCAT